MRVGVFTPLLSQLSLEDVLKKLKAKGINTVELGTGNYPGNAHCNLSMLDDKSELDSFRKKLSDHGFSISALSCHGNALHPDQERAKHDAEVSRKTVGTGRQIGSSCGGGFLRLSRRFLHLKAAQLGNLPLAAGLPGSPQMAVG